MAISTRVQLGQQLADGRLFPIRVALGFPHTMEFTGGVFSAIPNAEGGGSSQPPSTPRLYVSLQNKTVEWWDAVWAGDRFTMRVGSKAAAVQGQGTYMITAVSAEGELAVGQGDWNVYHNIALLDGTGPALPDDPEGMTVNQSLAQLWGLFNGLGGTFRGIYEDVTDLPVGSKDDLAAVLYGGEMVMWHFDGTEWSELPIGGSGGGGEDWTEAIASAVKVHNEKADAHLAQFDKKLDTVTTAGSEKVYAITSTGAQTMFNVSVNTDVNAVVKRDPVGQIYATTPTTDVHVANKKYVDDKVALLVPYTGATKDVDLGDNSLSAKSVKLTIKTDVFIPGASAFTVKDSQSDQYVQFTFSKSYMEGYAHQIMTWKGEWWFTWVDNLKPYEVILKHIPPSGMMVDDGLARFTLTPIPGATDGSYTIKYTLDSRYTITIVSTSVKTDITTLTGDGIEMSGEKLVYPKKSGILATLDDIGGTKIPDFLG